MSRPLSFALHGSTEPDTPTVLLCSGLGGLGAFWRPQLRALGARFRVACYDQRGTGANTEALPAAGYAVSAMAADAAGIAARLGATRLHFVGHALGGLVGLALASRAPELFASLTLVNAWAGLAPHTGRCFEARLHALAGGGVEAWVRAQSIFLYPAAWIEAHEAELAADAASAVRHFQGAATLAARLDALRSFEMDDDALARLRVPTLVIGATDDVLVPVQRSRHLADRIPGARLALMEGGHACNVTEPERFDAVLLDFLAGCG